MVEWKDRQSQRRCCGYEEDAGDVSNSIASQVPVVVPEMQRLLMLASAHLESQ